MKSEPLFRLPFHDYHPELRDGLRSLVERFPAQVVADAAQTLADDIALLPVTDNADRTVRGGS